MRLSAEELAREIGAKGGIGTVTGCVRGIRRNVSSRLTKHLGLTVAPDDLIRNDAQGYYLRDWITVSTPGGPAERPTVRGDNVSAPSRFVDAALPVPGDIAGNMASEKLNERQEWALDELRQGVRLQRPLLEQRFGVHTRTAKRDLADLCQRGLIEFVGNGPNGYYRSRASASEK